MVRLASHNQRLPPACTLATQLPNVHTCCRQMIVVLPATPTPLQRHCLSNPFHLHRWPGGQHHLQVYRQKRT